MAEQNLFNSITRRRPSLGFAPNILRRTKNDVATNTNDSRRAGRARLFDRNRRGDARRIGPLLAQLAPAANVVLISDANVHSLHGPAVADSLANSGAKVDTIVVEPGEQAKCAAVAESLWRQLLELGADRKTVVVALGGGVVGDLAGFVAATYARGLGLLQIPTTLLAQVDSSVGGKVGINLPGAKNMVGAFWQPLGVLIDTDTLTTLPRREYVSGLAEVVKYGVILDAEFFADLEANAAALVRAAIRRASPSGGSLLPAQGRRGRSRRT